MTLLDVLKASVLEELQGAQSEEQQGRYKNALILYSKALFSLCDYVIVKNNLKPPEDHRERFDILDRYFPFIHRTVKKVFRAYIETYLKSSDQESCEGMKYALRELREVEKLDPEIKTALEQV
ncbi:MAG TPA: hypothetical protein VJG90_08005 [Candidatus Nanoarchaeia archaeon]|nr:hypothetical protein [Candidatus Nanoarchaeia archaeon]